MVKKDKKYYLHNLTLAEKNQIEKLTERLNVKDISLKGSSNNYKI